MQSITCHKCGTSVASLSNFCTECGNSLKCRECKTYLKNGDKFCAECGTEINYKDTNNKGHNTFSFYKKGDEVSYDVSLSDEVGKEGIKSLVESIAQSNTPRTIDIRAVEDDRRIFLDQVPKVNSDDFTNSDTESTSEENNIYSDTSDDQYPHIDDLLRKRNCSEMEWILLFAFIESDYGQTTFTKEQVRDAYLDKRKNESRAKNFSNNWNGIHKSYLSTASEGIFRFEFEKQKIVSDFALGKTNGILKGAYEKSKSSSVKKEPNEKSNNTPIKSSKTSKQISLQEFDILKNAEKPSLQEMYNNFKPNSNKKIFGLIAYYICELNNSENFTAGNIDYAYRILKIPRKNNLIQLVNNEKNRTQWFEGIEAGVWTLNRLGRVQLEEMFQV